MTKCAVIILAGGSGKRFGSKKPKQFLNILDAPVFTWSLLAFKRTKLFSQIILVVPSNMINKLADTAKKHSFELACGGKERTDSVKAGLLLLKNDISYVAIHDAARPLIKPDAIRRSLDCAKKHGSGITSVPARDTIKLAFRHKIVETIPRDSVWYAQTPQVFKRNVIEKAYSKIGRNNVTDDAQAVERLGVKVFVCMGDYSNIKITDRNDFSIALTELKLRNSRRINS